MGEQVGERPPHFCKLAEVVPPLPYENSFPHGLSGRSPMLTNIQCKNALCPAGEKRARFADSGGLYLEVSPTGSKRWFLKYRINGKESRLAIGAYPAVSLVDARLARDQAKAQRRDGVDPVAARKAKRAELAVAPKVEGATFRAVALEWYGNQVAGWSDTHAERCKRQLERDLFPLLGDRPMASIQPMELLDAVKLVEKRGAIETAYRVLTVAGQVWKYWLPTAGPAQRNITEGLVNRLTPYRGKKFAAIVDPGRMGELMRAIRAYKGGLIVGTALRLAPLLYQRPGNLREMEWAELDLDAATWTIPSAKMKRTKAEKEHGEPHVVPMPRQAVALLRELQPFTGRGRYVFHGERDHQRPISDNSVRSALYALGFGKEQSWHGFRASARTMLVDQLNLDHLAIEANLAHAVKDANGRSYNRTQYLKQRFDQIQQWADYLDRLAAGAEVIPMPQRVA